MNKTVLKTMTIIFHPEKHTHPDLDNISKLIESAKKGQIQLVLEDYSLYLTLAAETTVHSLESTSLVTIDVLLSVLIWILDTQYTMLKELEREGIIVTCVYVYICYYLNIESEITEINQLVTRIHQGPEIVQSVTGIMSAIKVYAQDLPGDLDIRVLKRHVIEIVSATPDFGGDIVLYSIFHNVILREKNMADNLERIVGENPSIDTHVILGANHVSEMLSSSRLKSLEIPVHAFQRLRKLANDAYPKRRMTDILLVNYHIKIL